MKEGTNTRSTQSEQSKYETELCTYSRSSQLGEQEEREREM